MTGVNDLSICLAQKNVHSNQGRGYKYKLYFSLSYKIIAKGDTLDSVSVPEAKLTISYFSLCIALKCRCIQGVLIYLIVH